MRFIPHYLVVLTPSIRFSVFGDFTVHYLLPSERHCTLHLYYNTLLVVINGGSVVVEMFGRT